MGHYSQLYLTNDGVTPERGELSRSATPYLLSKYHIPLLWLALFSSNDIREGDIEGEAWPYMVKGRHEAIALLRSRTAFMEQTFPGLEHSWVEQFDALLTGTPLEFVHLETCDIGALMCANGDEWRGELQEFLRIFDPRQSSSETFPERLLYKSPQGPAWDKFITRFASAYAVDTPHEPSLYCGSSGADEDMEWEEPS